jgi:hypothetical protein
MRVKFIHFTGTVLCATAVLSAVSSDPARADPALFSDAGSASYLQSGLLTGEVPWAGIISNPADVEAPAPMQPVAVRWVPMAHERIMDASATQSPAIVQNAIVQNVQAAPSLEEIQQIQQELRDLEVPDPTLRRRRAYPGITIANPTGYGADRGQVFAGVGFQSRTRFSGGPDVSTIFGGGTPDGTAGIGFGIGDARESVGLQISYTAASFGGSRAPLSGGLNAKLHRRIGPSTSVAVGAEGIINFGRLPEDNDQIEFNDFEGTYYSAITHVFNLQEDFEQPFSRLALTAGAGSGRFRSVDSIANGEFAVGVFGSAALQVLPWANVITEWTGQDLAAGLSIAPFPNFPLVITPAVRDIVGEGDGTPRFVLGVGVSLSDIFSLLGL